METRAHHVLVGLFTLLTLLAALSFGVWLVQSGNDKETSWYRVIFEEAVTGLNVGSLVQYNGLRVGEIRALSLDPADPRRVFADIEISSATPINQGTRARMALANITGSANILLHSDTPNAPALEAPDGELPVILADPSAFGSLLGSGEALITGVDLLVGRGAALLSPDNLTHIGQILLNLELLSAELADSRRDLRLLLNSTNGVLQETHQLIADSRVLVQGTDQLVQQQGAALLGEGQRAMAALARSGVQLEQLLRQSRPGLTQGVDAVAELEPAVRELQRSLATLNRILVRLEQDPAGYLSGRPAVREFSP